MVIATLGNRSGIRKRLLRPPPARYSDTACIKHYTHNTRTHDPAHHTQMKWSVLLLVATVVASAYGHGRVVLPASRASAWRAGYNTVPNYDDDGCNCGGFYHQWEVNGGKCGICGDPYDAPAPRANELGGTYGQGLIVGEYTSGSVFDVTVVITAYHLGYWEFKICPDPDNNEQECFEQYLLELEDGGTKYYPKGSGRYEVRYRLPEDLVCEHCVLQWRYTTGNNWGDCNNGTQGLGCGNQENFGACSDITITSSSADDSNNLISDNMPLLLSTLLNKRDD